MAQSYDLPAAIVSDTLETLMGHLATDTVIRNHATATERTATLSTGQWDTVRAALLCYAAEQRRAGHEAWAESLIAAYSVLRNQTW
jgi:hypothetical protein